MPGELDEGDRVALQVEVWKTVVDVQQHFNDIELKIRGLALTVITAVLGAVALALKDGTTVLFLGVRWKLATIVIAFGVVIWRTFYQVDQVWYHRLLLGSVKQGIALEESLQAVVPGIELSKTIGAESPYEYERLGRWIGVWLRARSADTWGWTRKSLHSTDKLRRFYRTVTVLLLAMGLIVQVADVTKPAVAPNSEPTSTIGPVPPTSDPNAPVTSNAPAASDPPPTSAPTTAPTSAPTAEPSPNPTVAPTSDPTLPPTSDAPPTSTQTPNPSPTTLTESKRAGLGPGLLSSRPERAAHW